MMKRCKLERQAQGNFKEMLSMNAKILKVIPFFALFVLVASPVDAAKYTATPTKTEAASVKEKPAPKEKRECGAADYKNMDDYAKKLSKFSELVKLGVPDIGDMAENPGKQKKYMKAHKDFTAYLKSDAFEQVRQSYKVCEQEMPQDFMSEGFWNP